MLRGRFPHARFFSFTVSSPAAAVAPASLRRRHPARRGVDQSVPAGSRPRGEASLLHDHGRRPARPRTGSPPDERALCGRGRPGGDTVPGRRARATSPTGDATSPAESATPSPPTSPPMARCRPARPRARRCRPSRVRRTSPTSTPSSSPRGRSSSCSTSSTSPQHPAVNPTSWYKYFGPAWLLAPTTPAPRRPTRSRRSRSPRQGSARTPPTHTCSRGWIAASVLPQRHNIAVMHGKLPTTPADLRRRAADAARHATALLVRLQRRRPGQWQDHGPCLADEEVPIDARRDYTIVVSLPQDRPKNATAKCGVAWMDWARRATAPPGRGRP